VKANVALGGVGFEIGCGIAYTQSHDNSSNSARRNVALRNAAMLKL
jgi:hypothetical protein